MRWIEVPTTRHEIMVVMDCQMCLMGTTRNFPPPFDLVLFILCCSLIPFLLLNIVFVFLRFHSHSVLYNQYYTWNSPFRVRSPQPPFPSIQAYQPPLLKPLLLSIHISSHTTSEIALSNTVTHIAISQEGWGTVCQQDLSRCPTRTSVGIEKLRSL